MFRGVHLDAGKWHLCICVCFWPLLCSAAAQHFCSSGPNAHPHRSDDVDDAKKGRFEGPMIDSNSTMPGLKWPKRTDC